MIASSEADRQPSKLLEDGVEWQAVAAFCRSQKPLMGTMTPVGSPASLETIWMSVSGTSSVYLRAAAGGGVYEVDITSGSEAD